MSFWTISHVLLLRHRLGLYWFEFAQFWFFFLGPYLWSFLQSGDSVLSEMNCVKREDYLSSHRPSSTWRSHDASHVIKAKGTPPHISIYLQVIKGAHRFRCRDLFSSHTHTQHTHTHTHMHWHTCMHTDIKYQNKEGDGIYLPLWTWFWALITFIWPSLSLKSVDYLQLEYALSTEKLKRRAFIPIFIISFIWRTFAVYEVVLFYILTWVIIVFLWFSFFLMIFLYSDTSITVFNNVIVMCSVWKQINTELIEHSLSSSLFL